MKDRLKRAMSGNVFLRLVEDIYRSKTNQLISTINQLLKGMTMANHITIEALSPAALVHYLAELPHETRAIVTATENGTPWATVRISPMTNTRRGVFPAYSGGAIGDTSKRGQSGVILNSLSERETSSGLSVVIERARRMALGA